MDLEELFALRVIRLLSPIKRRRLLRMLKRQPGVNYRHDDPKRKRLDNRTGSRSST
jgi:hypothetical protein